MTLDPPAEYGQTGLGITSFSIKSGTNQLHGSVYEYLRNEALDSRGFFAPTTPINKQNEFGVLGGGPVVIPKIYNGKDKTFFFAWYHGYRRSQQASNTLDTLPTEAMKGGDFSNILGSQISSDALGRPVYAGAVYDPSSQRTVAGGAVDPATGLVNTSGAARFCATPSVQLQPTAGSPPMSSRPVRSILSPRRCFRTSPTRLPAQAASLAIATTGWHSFRRTRPSTNGGRGSTMRSPTRIG